MTDMKEALENMKKQFQEVDGQANELVTLRTKLVGAIEFASSMIESDESQEAPKETPVKEKKNIKIDEITTTIPSPFAFNLIAQGITDILKIEDRVEFLRRMHKNVLAKIGSKKGINKEEFEFNYTDMWKKAEEKKNFLST